MAIRLGDTAPDFTAETTQGTINFHEWLGDSWGVLFSHPKDFTPVCTTELGYVAKLKPEFDKRNVKVIGLSVDPVDSHDRWDDDIEETQGTAAQLPDDRRPRQQGRRPLRHDPPERQRHRRRCASVFVIGPDKKVKLTITYPAVDRPQLRRDPARHRLAPADRRLQRVATPANWKDGEDVIIVPSVSDEDAKEQVPERLGRPEAVPAGSPSSPALAILRRDARGRSAVRPRSRAPVSPRPTPVRAARAMQVGAPGRCGPSSPIGTVVRVGVDDTGSAPRRGPAPRRRPRWRRGRAGRRRAASARGRARSTAATAPRRRSRSSRSWRTSTTRTSGCSSASHAARSSPGTASPSSVLTNTTSGSTRSAAASMRWEWPRCGGSNRPTMRPVVRRRRLRPRRARAPRAGTPSPSPPPVHPRRPARLGSRCAARRHRRRRAHPTPRRRQGG